MALADNLVAYWKLNESSGTRYDFIGSGDLTSYNNVPSASGKIGDAASFIAASGHSLRRTSIPELQAGDIDFTIVAWVKLNDKSADRPIVQKFSKFGTNQREYRLQYANSDDRYQFVVSQDGNAAPFGLVNADIFGSPPTGVWSLVFAWHDPVANTVNIQVNNGTSNNSSYAGGIHVDTSDFEIGSLDNNSNYYDGEIDEVGVWKRNLSSTERNELYNAGQGRTPPYALGNITTTIKPSGGGDYSSFAAWEAGQQKDLVALEAHEKAVCYGGDLEALDMDGWVADSTYFVDIEAHASSEHDGTFPFQNSSTAYVSSLTTTSIFCRVPHTRVTALGLSATATATTFTAEGPTASSIVLNRLLCRGGGAESVVFNNNASGISVVKNCIIVDSAVSIVARGGADTHAKVYNCTLQSSTTASLQVAGGASITEDNNYLKTNAGNNYDDLGGIFNKGTHTATNNAEAVASGLRNVAYDNTNFVNTTYQSENLHLSPSSFLIGSGTDLSSEGVLLDIDGQSRPGSIYDIGADQYQLDSRNSLWLFVGNY